MGYLASINVFVFHYTFTGFID